MSIIFILLPMSLCFSVVALIASLWAVRAGQYNDLDGDSVRFLGAEED